MNFGVILRSISTKTKGRIKTGVTLSKICQKESIKLIDAPVLPIHDRKMGATTDNVTLLIIEYPATVAIFPPNIPAITGAEVAVDASIQIITA